MRQNNNRKFILVHKKNEAGNITSLFFKPADGLDYNFTSGQYVNIKPLSVSGHGKSYTISSCPHEKIISLTIKRAGTVSSALIDSPLGETVTLEGPFGYFYPEENCGDMVMIAGGIGITPLYSIIKSKIRSKNKTALTLFYSNKRVKEAAFFEELNELKKNNPHFNVIHTLTQSDIKHPFVQEYSRINGDMLKKHLGSFKGKSYFICGSIQFVNDMWNILKESGVSESSIFTESFY